MTNRLKELGLGVMASLIASYLFPLFPQIEIGKDSKGLELMIEKYSFLINWIMFFVLLIVVRWFIRKTIEKLQTPAPRWFGARNYDKEIYKEIHGFNWMIHADIRHKDPFGKEKLDVYVGQVDGPYCKNDDREMKLSRTYLGRYKYKCPKCGYKKTLFKNRWTLEGDIKDEIEALARKQIRTNQQ
ncbi:MULTISPECIES: hypothetical protein [Bacillus cereus group]|uniref:Uncharacterized protein n=1 Tax=Bacillus cereus VD118 TaxID=1053231 RepID=R8QAJ5_BACCE|nr:MULTISPECIES: hypothetical protein [Bacillus cereus group]EOP67408.1 hypothetical protein IIQ_05361 [Bacillus cereus VD118]MBJ8095373.1 hypothetical protein [Bacillus cereus]MCQ6359505.1 hypothetical protein [Bacillus cereus]CAH2464427.1 hypothetical protein ACOSJ1_EBGNOMHC_04961 [Bacillus mycoides KBAB4]